MISNIMIHLIRTERSTKEQLKNRPVRGNCRDYHMDLVSNFRISTILARCCLWHRTPIAPQYCSRPVSFPAHPPTLTTLTTPPQTPWLRFLRQSNSNAKASARRKTKYGNIRANRYGRKFHEEKENNKFKILNTHPHTHPHTVIVNTVKAVMVNL